MGKINARRSYYKFLPGLNLVEVLLYILVVLGLFTVLLSSAGTLSKSFSSNLETTATIMDSCEIERLRKLDFASLPSSGALGLPCSQDLSKFPAPNSATRTVSDYQNNPDIKQVVVTVTWTENGITKDAKVETLITKYGLD